MVAYSFETITEDQALAIRAGDTLTINAGPAARVSVTYQSYDPLALSPELSRILVMAGGRTVSFATDLTQLSKVGAIVMADGTQLYIGDTGPDRAVGGDGADGLNGGPGSDALDGGRGGDLLQGNGGDDTLTGGDGGDSIHGGQGNDVIFTGQGVAGAAGEAGDWANGNLGDDEIVGGGGSDTLLGGQGDDVIGGGDGDDYLSGDRGNDELHGGMGSDTLVGGEGNDTLQGGFGLDVLSGGDGDDRLVAQGPGITLLSGGTGNDTLTAASADKDILLGGIGADRFEIVGKTAPSVRIDAEIRDWEASDTMHFPQVSIFGVGAVLAVATAATAAAAILPRSYSEVSAHSYAEALAIADEHIAHTGAQYVAAQVGSDVFVFADTNGDAGDGADVAVALTGRSLDDLSLANFV